MRVKDPAESCLGWRLFANHQGLALCCLVGRQLRAKKLSFGKENLLICGVWGGAGEGIRYCLGSRISKNIDNEHVRPYSTSFCQRLDESLLVHEVKLLCISPFTTRILIQRSGTTTPPPGIPTPIFLP